MWQQRDAHARNMSTPVPASPTLLCLCGISGSGKTTLAEELRRHDWTIIRPVFWERGSEDACVQALRDGLNVVVDSYNFGVEQRGKWLDLARHALGRGVQLLALEMRTPPEECTRRVARRGLADIRAVDDATHRMLEEWCAVGPREGFDEVLRMYHPEELHTTVDAILQRAKPLRGGAPSASWVGGHAPHSAAHPPDIAARPDGAPHRALESSGPSGYHGPHVPAARTVSGPGRESGYGESGAPQRGRVEGGWPPFVSGPPSHAFPADEPYIYDRPSGGPQELNAAAYHRSGAWSCEGGRDAEYARGDPHAPPIRDGYPGGVDARSGPRSGDRRGIHPSLQVPYPRHGGGADWPDSHPPYMRHSRYDGGAMLPPPAYDNLPPRGPVGPPRPHLHEPPFSRPWSAGGRRPASPPSRRPPPGSSAPLTADRHTSSSLAAAKDRYLSHVRQHGTGSGRSKAASKEPPSSTAPASHGHASAAPDTDHAEDLQQHQQHAEQEHQAQQEQQAAAATDAARSSDGHVGSTVPSSENGGQDGSAKPEAELALERCNAASGGSVVPPDAPPPMPVALLARQVKARAEMAVEAPTPTGDSVDVHLQSAAEDGTRRQAGRSQDDIREGASAGPVCDGNNGGGGVSGVTANGTAGEARDDRDGRGAESGKADRGNGNSRDEGSGGQRPRWQGRNGGGGGNRGGGGGGNRTWGGGGGGGGRYSNGRYDEVRVLRARFADPFQKTKYDEPLEARHSPAASRRRRRASDPDLRDTAREGAGEMGGEVSDERPLDKVGRPDGPQGDQGAGAIARQAALEVAVAGSGLDCPAASAGGLVDDGQAAEATAAAGRGAEEGGADTSTAACTERDTRPILLFDLNGTITSHTSVRKASGSTKPRPGTGALLKLKSHFRLGVFTSSTVRTVNHAVQLLEEEAGGTLFEPRLILHREHTQPASREQRMASGQEWDTVKPLARWFAHLDRVLLLDDDAYKAMAGEERNMVLVPTWEDEDAECSLVETLVDTLIEVLAPLPPDADLREFTATVSARLATAAASRIAAMGSLPVVDDAAIAIEEDGNEADHCPAVGGGDGAAGTDSAPQPIAEADTAGNIALEMAS